MNRKTIKPITLAQAFSEKRLGHSSLFLTNSFIKSATYEGMFDKGIPNQKLIDHHVALAKGGVALTTVSYGAVSANGRTFEDQMYINKRSLKVLKKLAKKVHEAGGKISIQLTHCGFFSKNIKAVKIIAPSRIFNAYGFLSGMGFSQPMKEKDFEKVIKDYIDASIALKAIGFDALEIHMGHGYLLSQFLSPLTNKRTDQYGGNIKNRSRFPLAVIKNVVKAVGKEFPVLAKLNLNDGVKGGFSIEDCIDVSKQLEQAGCAAIVLSGGFTSKSPFYMMRGKVPLRGMIQNGDSWIEKITMLLFGPLIIRRYRFAPNFFLNQALKVRQAVSIDLVYVGGAESKEGFLKILNYGFDFIALARPLIHDPEFPNKIREGQIDKSGCNRCNQCIVEMDRGGIRCVLNS